MTTALELARDLLRFETVNPPGDERACADHVARLLEGAGFAVTAHEFADRRRSLVARLGGAAGRPPLCLTGHLDVVPLGSAPWSRDPFAGEVAGGRLYGRGASDMKSGLAAMLVAVQRLAPRLGGTPGVILVLTAGEETLCQGAHHLARADGALGRAGAIVAAEPTGNAPLVGHKGALWVEVRAAGVTAHGSMPERGVNAIYRAARAVTALERFEFGVAPHPVLGHPTLNVGTIRGGLNVNSVPDQAIAAVDIRTVPGQDHVALLERLRASCGSEVAVEPVASVSGVWTEPGHSWVAEVFDVVAAVTGERPGIAAAPYVTDLSALVPALGAPAVVLGPGELAMAHQTDEYCVVDRIDQAVEIYGGLIRRWCGL